MSISSTEPNPVDAVTDILEQSTDSDYTGDKPGVIERVEERAPQERNSTTGAALYIWQPTDADLERVSADGDLLNRVSQVEIFIYVLEDQARAVKLQEDLIRFLGTFMDDNRDRTDLNSIEPNVLSDSRTANLPRNTRHHATGIEVECIQKITLP